MTGFPVSRTWRISAGLVDQAVGKPKFGGTWTWHVLST
jgi:hypothetical protein